MRGIFYVPLDVCDPEKRRCGLTRIGNTYLLASDTWRGFAYLRCEAVQACLKVGPKNLELARTDSFGPFPGNFGFS